MPTQKTRSKLQPPVVSGSAANHAAPTISYINDALAITAVVLRCMPSSKVIDKATVVSGYAELVAMYPEVLAFRSGLADSLDSLADFLELKGAIELSKQTRRVTITGHSSRGRSDGHPR